jgi:hypothetical protein
MTRYVMFDLQRPNVPSLLVRAKFIVLSRTDSQIPNFDSLLQARVGGKQVFHGIGSRFTGPLGQSGALGAIWQGHEVPIFSALLTVSTIVPQSTSLRKYTLSDFLGSTCYLKACPPSSTYIKASSSQEQRNDILQN